MPNGAEERSGREIRLLLLVIAIAVAGLVVLARFRFPAADIVAVTPTPGPLERLAARAPFDELAATVAATAERLAPLVAVVEFDQIPPPPVNAKGRMPRPNPRTPEPQNPRTSEPQNPRTSSTRYFAPALRVRADRWLVYQAAGTRAVRSGSGPVMVAAEDTGRQLALLGLSGRTEPDPQLLDFSSAVHGFPGTSYALVIEAAPAGPAARPVFIPRLDPVSAAPWDSPILRVGGTMPVAAGALVFSLDGRFIGLTVPLEDGVAIVAAATLSRLTGELAGGGQ
jgi:hypothetical protein